MLCWNTGFWFVILFGIIQSSMHGYNDDYDNGNSAYQFVAKKYGFNGTLTVQQIITFLKEIEFSGSVGFHEYIASLSANYENLEYNIVVNSSLFNDICSTAVLDIEESGFLLCKKNSNLLEKASTKPSSSAVWGFGFLSVTIISLCSLVGISILPLMKSKMYDKVLLYLICLAVGTLSSNGIFQLIPEGFGIDGNPLTVWQSAVIFGGFYLFYLTESLLERVFNNSHTHSVDSKLMNEGKTNSSNDSSEKVFCSNKDDKRLSDWSNESPQQSKEVLLNTTAGKSNFCCNQAEENSLRPASVVVGKQKQCWLFKNYKSIKTIAWMITVADGIHNFIDGLAIGASFSTSMVQGVSTSLAIFCEEFPHELGDFAILISSGMTMKQAAFYNFASACCCYLGLIFGILLGNDLSSAQWIFAFAGGVFLYISLAGMLPEAQAHCSKQSLKQQPWLCLFIKNLGLLSGFSIMLILTAYKDDIRI